MERLAQAMTFILIIQELKNRIQQKSFHIRFLMMHPPDGVTERLRIRFLR